MIVLPSLCRISGDVELPLRQCVRRRDDCGYHVSLPPGRDQQRGREGRI